MSFWWCLAHGRVEGGPDDAGCANMDRLGPYETREQAAGALDRARARTAEQDARDEAEDDWGTKGRQAPETRSPGTSDGRPR